MPKVQVEIPSSTIDAETKNYIASLERTVDRLEKRVATLSNRKRKDEDLRKKIYEARDILIETIHRLNERFDVIE